MLDDELTAMANAAEGEFRRRKRTMTDFRYDELQEKYWDTTSGALLGARSVDGAIPIDEWPTKENSKGDQKPYSPAKAINDVDTGLTVEGSTWWPGKPKYLENVVVSERGAMTVMGAVYYNLYIPPDPVEQPEKVTHKQWVDHVKKLYPEQVEFEMFFDFCAHMLQRPDEKVNFGLVMAGAQGIGKDTALLPVRKGVGEWNAAEVGPDAITSQYNGFLKSVLLIINEVRPQDEDHKASNFYNLLKPILASPPEMLAMNQKYVNTIFIRNLCHVLLTTNDPLTMYIPAEDRRLFVMTSALKDPKAHKVFPAQYFEKLHHYLAHGGNEAVIHWLLQRDLSKFSPTQPPPMTAGKDAIIGSATTVRYTAVDEVVDNFLDHLFKGGKPDVIFACDLLQYANQADYFDDSEKVVGMLKGRTLHFKMNERGYDMVKNPEVRSGEWKNGKFRSRAAFISNDIPSDDRLKIIKSELKKRPLEFTVE
jgi:hypothetical protein